MKLTVSSKTVIENLHSMSVPEIRQAALQLGPPYPRKLLDALGEDKRVGVQRVLEDLCSRQRLHGRQKRRIQDMLRYEREAQDEGYAVIAGVDEVGRGPLAGPVVAAAVILPPDVRWADVNDSKLLTDERRREALTLISAAARIGVGVVSVEEIERINIHRASLLAFKLAIEDLDRVPDMALIDGRHKTTLDIPQRAIVKGDRSSLSIAAASIVAKVTRDEMMLEYDRRYPEYGFAKHKGYGTPEHLAMIRKFGICPIHRRSFAGVRETSQYQLI